MGKSADFEKRLYQIQQEFGSKLKLLDVIKSSDAIALEKKMHEHFNDRRFKGEWFILSEEEVEKAIDSVKEVQGG